MSGRTLRRAALAVGVVGFSALPGCHQWLGLDSARPRPDAGGAPGALGGAGPGGAGFGGGGGALAPCVTEISAPEPVVPGARLIAGRLSEPPRIDGELDDVWCAAVAYEIRSRGADGSPEDFQAYVQFGHAQGSFFVAFTVLDDDLVLDEFFSYEGDGPYLEIDLAGDGGGFLDPDQWVFYFRPLRRDVGVPENAVRKDTVPLGYGEAAIEGGYRIELELPKTMLEPFSAMPGASFGIKAIIRDKDGSAPVVEWSLAADFLAVDLD